MLKPFGGIHLKMAMAKPIELSRYFGAADEVREHQFSRKASLAPWPAVDAAIPPVACD